MGKIIFSETSVKGIISEKMTFFFKKFFAVSGSKGMGSSK
jgi:hypothetical protein